ncbi:MAG: FixH family protein [Campylobacterota bacterium]|nr:FixH family protein [Campylobacterota bacterium]
MNLSNGRIWPYTIAFLILMVFGFCVATIMIANTLPVEKSDSFMTSYQDANTNANKLIQARIDFNKKYKLEYISDKLDAKGTVFRYKITDLDSNPVSGADIKVIITRPNKHKYDIELNNPVFKNGVYEFPSTVLPKEGRWDIMAKINVGKYQRFYNFKTDTRTTKIKQY